MDSYRYIPLSGEHGFSIRLLEVSFVDDGHATISSTTHMLEDSPLYLALSYRWSSSGTPLPIIINGKFYSISRSLWFALKRIHQRVTTSDRAWPRKLWVDGLCINQEDDQEKSSQVARMNDIYSKAASVLVWLGEADDLTPLAFDTLHKFEADDGTSDGSRVFHEIDKPAERRDSLRRLIHRPWFSRVWVVQEVVVASSVTVQCGLFFIDWEIMRVGLERATGSGFYHFNHEVGKITKIGMWRAKFHELQQSASRDEALDLHILIMDASDNGATNLRDKVYALRGIASKAYANGIIVNYQDPVEKVYIDCAKHLLQMRNDLRVLSLVRRHHRHTTSLHLPSWVPDWSQSMDSGGVLQRYYRFLPERMFRACHGTSSQVVLSNDGVSITVTGVRLGRVTTVFPINDLILQSSPDGINLSPRHLKSIAERLTLPPVYPETLEPSWLALFRAMTADRTAFSPRINDFYRMRYLSAVSVEGLSAEDTTVPWHELSPSLESIIDGKVLFITDQNLLGFTEFGCQPGEIVCVFLGGEVPFLVQTRDNDCFHLHGEAYLHGMMDGEAFARRDPAAMGLEQFKIE
ncbi:heterokaryon incompatibility protein-domain-containing protein [Nemania sp. FL0031]|nr:heterokaryon incompatibility protein-domain-containing protein [Nemania sp. FL0031]